jgi:hypothetical protein
MESVSRLLFKVRRKLRKKLRDVALFRHYLARRGRPQPRLSEKAVWFDLHNNSYVRYLYILFKYFESAGYQVYLNGNLRFLLSLGDDYSRFIIEEGHVQFAATPPEGALRFTDGTLKGALSLSNDYFLEGPGPGCYHIPIGMHPHMYKYGWWNAPYDDSQRQHSVFFAGNFDPNDYKIFSSSGKFTMMDRLTMAKELYALKECRFPKSFAELTGEQRPGSVDVVDKANFIVEQSDLRPIIARYAFFIACPGVFMPLSHNIYEAMSVGTVPIIHEEYAQLFAPALADGHNAVLFNNDNFTEKLREALAYPAEKVATMVQQAKEYYLRHLAPAAIVDELFKGGDRRIYLNAEKSSIAKLTARTRKERASAVA